MWLAATLTDQLVTLGLGFVLTTVVGGLLGSWFQRRAWEHQHLRTLAEADRDHATQVCRELSQLMDKRLYRMWQLSWALSAAEFESSRLDACLEDYRAVLYEWNDNLNRNLAAAEIQFGPDARDRLEREIFEGFRLLGGKLEVRYREVRRRPAPGEADFSDQLAEMRERIYAMTLAMLSQIREERVGRQLMS
jgi:hypothetical protein